MPTYQHIVTQAEQGSRIDALLATFTEVSSRGEAVRLLEDGQVLLNNNRHTAKKRIVLAEDVIEYTITPQPEQSLAAECIALDICYEDEYLIVLSKEAGMVVHPAQGHDEGTLVNALLHHCGYENLALLQGEDRPGIVHRLDKDTSGLMLVAKDEQAGLALQEGIRTRNIERRYLTLVHGYIAPETGLVDAPIIRGSVERMRMTVGEGPSAREAITSFKVLDRYEANTHDDGYTYLECKLYTGRTHQIRVHMDYIGHPCVGDALYGRYGYAAQLGLSRQFLHSWFLSLTHPVTGELMEFEDSLPPDLASVLESLECRKL
ncbi:MAG: RluA family pseudouridine synthase [Coriobacteriia bacterium]|nr:RluA family pseudouridine synthase [Coriobacteriia bacterium]MCL2750568.1 RluA family pseudouridine synthase [Coriobacteriia bacterium]